MQKCGKLVRFHEFNTIELGLVGTSLIGSCVDGSLREIGTTARGLVRGSRSTGPGSGCVRTLFLAGSAGFLTAALFFVTVVEGEQIGHLTLITSLFFFLST